MVLLTKQQYFLLFNIGRQEWKDGFLRRRPPKSEAEKAGGERRRRK